MRCLGGSRVRTLLSHSSSSTQQACELFESDSAFAAEVSRLETLSFEELQAHCDGWG